MLIWSVEYEDELDSPFYGKGYAKTANEAYYLAVQEAVRQQESHIRERQSLLDQMKRNVTYVDPT